MFRIVRAELTVKDGSMKAAVTLGGKGYLKLFMGTGEEALAADSVPVHRIFGGRGRSLYV